MNRPRPEPYVGRHRMKSGGNVEEPEDPRIEQIEWERQGNGTAEPSVSKRARGPRFDSPAEKAYEARIYGED